MPDSASFPLSHTSEVYELFEDADIPGQWRVEASGEDGERFIAAFSGDSAYELALAYAQWVSSDLSPRTVTLQIFFKDATGEPMQHVRFVRRDTIYRWEAEEGEALLDVIGYQIRT